MFLKHFMAIVFEYLSKGEKKRLVFCCKLKKVNLLKLVSLSLHGLTFACYVFCYLSMTEARGYGLQDTFARAENDL